MATNLPIAITASVISALSGLGTIRPFGAAGGATPEKNTAIAASMIEAGFADDGNTQPQLGWISQYVAVPFTLAGTVTFQIRAYESASTVNVSIRMKLMRLPYGSLSTPAAIGTFNRGSEITTSAANINWTGSPTSTPFAVNDRLLAIPYWYPIGTAGAGTAIYVSNSTSYVELTEDVVFSSSPILMPVSPLKRLYRMGERAIL